MTQGKTLNNYEVEFAVLHAVDKDLSTQAATETDNFKECVDTSNNVDVSVYRGDVEQKSCGTLQLTYGLEQSDQIYTLICNVYGDTVKLSKSTGHLALFEIVVTNTGNFQLLSYLLNNMGDI